MFEGLEIFHDYTVAIIGSRTFTDKELAFFSINELLINNRINITKIVSGGAVGADKIAELYALENSIPIEVFIPNWKLGRHAGFLRNKTIVNNCDIVIAFWNGVSKGTLHSINYAKKNGKTVYIVMV